MSASGAIVGTAVLGGGSGSVASSVARLGDGDDANLQPSYYCNSEQDIGWDLTNRCRDSIHTLRYGSNWGYPSAASPGEQSTSESIDRSRLRGRVRNYRNLPLLSAQRRIEPAIPAERGQLMSRSLRHPLGKYQDHGRRNERPGRSRRHRQ